MSKSSTTTKQISSPTPGEVSLLDFIQPMGLTQNGLARAVGVPPRRINEIVLGKRSITADTDLRLARFFGVSDGFWLGLQTAHDLLQQRREIDADLAPYRRAAGMENVWSPRGLTSPATRITRTRSPRQT